MRVKKLIRRIGKVRATIYLFLFWDKTAGILFLKMISRVTSSMKISNSEINTRATKRFGLPRHTLSVGKATTRISPSRLVGGVLKW